MKKTIGILTFHRSDSYGASLQAYASVKAIEQLGHHAELIDYTNSYEQQKHKPKGKGIKRILKDVKWQIASIVFHNSKWLDRAFGNKDNFYEGCISKKKYHNHEELSMAQYDILLSGSDQIWNPDITGAIDTAYLLEYGKARKRVAYASSMGSRILSENEKEIFRALLGSFDTIGVREEFAKNQLSGLTDVPISVVCDPTLLLNEMDWNEMANSATVESFVGKSPFAIAFFVGSYTRENKNFVYQTINIMDTPVFIIQKNKRHRPGCDKSLAGVTVPEFVSLIKHAEFIITDSFHAVVFSLIMNKKFIPVANQKNPVRVEELLRSLGLNDRINKPEKIREDIDYVLVNEKLKQMREDGMTWLKEALE